MDKPHSPWLILLAASCAAVGAARADEPPVAKPGQMLPATCERQEYPAAARRANAVGTTKLSFQVDAEGVANAIEVTEPSGSTPAHQLLDETAIRMLKSCHFVPGAASAATSAPRFKVEYLWRLEGVTPPVSAAAKSRQATLTEAAERGDLAAAYTLGGMYLRGTELPRDDTKALALFQQLADAGDSRGQRALAWMLENGRGTTRDDAKAAHWYRQAADKGDPDAMLRLAYFYRRGWGGLAKDVQEARRLYERAALLGNPLALHELGVYHANAPDKDRQVPLAATYFAMASRLGNLNSQRELEALDSKLTSDQRQSARTFAEQWTPSQPLPTAATPTVN